MLRDPFLEKLSIQPSALPALLPPIVVTAILSFALGYWIGTGNPSFSPSKTPHVKWKSSSENRAGASIEIPPEDEADCTENIHQKVVPQEECKLVCLGDPAIY